MRSAPVLPAALFSALAAATALAKLPPPTEEAKAAAAETAAKNAWSEKVGAYKTCLAQDRAVQAYQKNPNVTVKTAPSTKPVPSCVDPGPYVSATTSPANKPLEASGAHSPAGLATSPPSNKATAADIAGGVKKPAPN